MTERTQLSKKRFSPDWFMRGALTRLGDSFDRLTGRKWVRSSSLTASELIERINKLLDSEAIDVEGKGKVVPHHIQLKMQWNKFSDDAEDSLKTLQAELMAAAVDHINDSLYYTYAPVSLEIKPDYFIEGVKLFVSFDEFDEEKRDVELNVTVPAINIADIVSKPADAASAPGEVYVARFAIKGAEKEKRLDFSSEGRCTVGRTGGNDLVLDDTSVSKMHAALSVTADGNLFVADTGSTNGTFINDQRIAYGKAMVLVEGDKVRFGQIKVIFERQSRPIVLETEESVATEADEEAVEIDGLEFKRRVSPDTPADPHPVKEVPSPAVPHPYDSPDQPKQFQDEVIEDQENNG
jgi:pSer/pThr/pTyr-binding forkhead associated (FHA) protein